MEFHPGRLATLHIHCIMYTVIMARPNVRKITSELLLWSIIALFNITHKREASLNDCMLKSFQYSRSLAQTGSKVGATLTLEQKRPRGVKRVKLLKCSAHQKTKWNRETLENTNTIKTGCSPGRSRYNRYTIGALLMYMWVVIG